MTHEEGQKHHIVRLQQLLEKLVRLMESGQVLDEKHPRLINLRMQINTRINTIIYLDNAEAASRAEKTR